ncbi:hypothetical protein ACFT7S_12705 [Streptomyces sp. NPDC057136]|uniref:hypothetical protein n=1 Tax=Streptomyces sp. NPDC057136 TaxID=3346029 RepID=UPI0036430458
MESVDDGDVVIRPHQDEARGTTTWLLSREGGPQGMTVAKMRITHQADAKGGDELGVHPGTDWFTVLSGTVLLLLGERRILVEALY